MSRQRKQIITELEPGAESLSVPMIGDAIQVDYPTHRLWEDCDKKRLEVVAAKSMVSMFLEDRSPFQIEAVQGRAGFISKRRVLSEPVSNLRIEEGDGELRVIGGEVVNPQGLISFAKIIRTAYRAKRSKRLLGAISPNLSDGDIYRAIEEAGL